MLQLGKCLRRIALAATMVVNIDPTINTTHSNILASNCHTFLLAVESAAMALILPWGLDKRLF
jgi:hypothetical protein